MSEESKIGLAILGSTGELGKRTLELLNNYPVPYKVEVLTADINADLLIEQALKFKPNVVVIRDDSLRQKVDDVLWEEDIKTYSGTDALFQVTEMKDVSVVVNAITGKEGIKPSTMAACSGKNLILGNTESLIHSAEELVEEVVKRGTKLFPVDQLQSAVFQLLRGEEVSFVHQLTIGSDHNDELIQSITQIFNLDQNKIEFDPNINADAEVEFIDGVKKSISNVTKEQALQSALFYPLRMKIDDLG